MKVARTIRYSIIKSIRFWKWKWRVFCAELKYAFEPIRRANQTNNENQNSTKESPRNPSFTWDSCPENLANPDPARANYPDSATQACHGIKWWKDRLEIVGIIGGLIVGFLIFLQYVEMAKATNATKDAVVVAQGQLKEMRENRNLDERAWVLATGMPKNITITYFNTYMINISFKNTGRTPAINVKSFCNWSARTNDIPENEDIIKMWENEGLCAPDSGGEIQPLEPIPTAVLDHASAASPIFIYGKIRYDDIFTNSHWSQFCFKIFTIPMQLGQIEFTGCEIHNSCDDAEPNKSR